MTKKSNKKYFGTDGIRGKVGESLINPEFVLKLGWAVGKVLANGERKRVIIGKDTRISGYLLESALEAGLSAAGVDIGLLGPMPTPAIAYLTRTFRASVGIVISASHNPYYDNGIKFFNEEGVKFSDDLEWAIEKEMEKPLEVVPSNLLGKAFRIEDAPGRYIEFCKSTVPSHMRLYGLNIVVDCAHGAAYNVAGLVFRELGANVIKIGTEPNGLNINEGYGSTEPQELIKAVKEHKADLGIALDGDADRVVMVDKNGKLLDGDDLLFIIAKDRLLTKQLTTGVVGTQMTNIGCELAMIGLGIDFHRSLVGDRYVIQALQERGWYLGGESSGHIVCLDKTTTGDGIVSALQVLYAMFRQEKPLHELLDGMEKFPQILINVPVASNKNIVNTAPVQNLVKSMEAKLQNEGRVLLRASGTEPVVRVMVEGKDQQLVEVCAQELACAIEGVNKA